MLSVLLFASAPAAVVSKDDLLDFNYSWSREAAATPTLDRRFRTDALRQKQVALATANDDRKARRAMAAEWHGHYFSAAWTTAGRTPRLLSLEQEISAYTGGAHGNSGTLTLLWDRRTGRETGIDSLLARAGHWTGAIRQPFCALLDRERAKRRGGPVKRSDMFGDCPAWKDLTVTLEDKDRDQRLDHVRITADPYIAGPYAEGEYVISLPITATMISRLKPEYRLSFGAQPPVQ